MVRIEGDKIIQQEVRYVPNGVEETYSSFDEMLALFSDDSNLVRPLILELIKVRAELEAFAKHQNEAIKQAKVEVLEEFAKDIRDATHVVYGGDWINKRVSRIADEIRSKS